jgi:hypothetical protein
LDDKRVISAKPRICCALHGKRNIREILRAMSQENVEIVRRLHEAFDAVGMSRVRDLAAEASGIESVQELERLGEVVAAHVDPEIEVILFSTRFSLPDMPHGVPLRGFDGWIDFWRGWLEPWERFEYEYGNFATTGDHVVLDKTISASGRGSDLPVEVEIAELWTVRDRRIVRHAIFDTRGEALKAAGLSE